MSGGGVSFGGDNNNTGSQAFGDGDVVSHGAVKGDGNTVTNTYADAGESWPDAIAQAETEGGAEAKKAAEHLQSLSDVEQLDETQQAEAQGAIATLKSNAPDALRLVGKLLEKGPMGAAGMLFGMVADRIE